MNHRTILKAVAAQSVTMLLAIAAPAADVPGRWPAQKANAWGEQTGWLVGCNYTPAYAINQLEMWQADTFDPAAIDRELGWAESLGFNSLRVYLHDLLWEQDSQGYLDRMERFLDIADKHRIGVMFVLLDGVWDPFPRSGRQRAPRPYVHNSGWVQSPHQDVLKDPARHDELKPYIEGVIRHFGKDKRIHAWDLYNEPNNPNRLAYGTVELPDKAERARQLLAKVFAWARAAQPTQPLTAGVWKAYWPDHAKLSPIDKLMLEQSDIISFHCYGRLDPLKRCVRELKHYGRPLLLTEYMARPAGSTFDPNLAYLKEQNVAAYNWGFVAGKTQTNCPWDTWEKTYTAEPPLWFHDILRADGSAYDPKEVDYIRRVTGKAGASTNPPAKP